MFSPDVLERRQRLVHRWLRTRGIHLTQKHAILLVIGILGLYNLTILQRLPAKWARRRAASSNVFTDEMLHEVDAVGELDTLAEAQDPADAGSYVPVDLRALSQGRPKHPEPHVCKRAEQECAHHKTCLNKKYQDIPSCSRAKSRCMMQPVGEQMIMPYCNSCLAPSRDIKGCQFEAVQCQKSREVCFKVWQKTRQDRCDPVINEKLVGVHWSVDSLKELVKATGANQDTDACAGAMIGEVGAYQENTQMVLRTWTKLQRKERAEAERKLQLARQAQARQHREAILKQAAAHAAAAKETEELAAAKAAKAVREKEGGTVVVGVVNEHTGKTDFVVKSITSAKAQREEHRLSQQIAAAEGTLNRMVYPELNINLDLE